MDPTSPSDPALTFEKALEELEALVARMKAYADERAVVAKANTDAGNAAIDEYNNTMKALQEANKNR